MTLHVVPPSDGFYLCGPFGVEHPTFTAAPECILNFALSPSEWPNSPAFWLGLATHGKDMEALGKREEGLQKPVFRNLWLIERIRAEASFCAVDFWFLAALIEQLDEAGYAIIDQATDLAVQPSSIPLPINEWIAKGVMRRRYKWREASYAVINEHVRRQFGLAVAA